MSEYELWHNKGFTLTVYVFCMIFQKEIPTQVLIWNSPDLKNSTFGVTPAKPISPYTKYLPANIAWPGLDIDGLY